MPVSAFAKLDDLFKGASPEDIMMWRRPHATGFLVGIVVVIIFIFGYLQYTWLTFTCRLVQLILGANFFLSKVMNSKITANDVADHIVSVVDWLRPLVVKWSNIAAKVIVWDDPALSTKVLLFSLGLSFIGSLFSDLTLMFLGAVVVFAGPIVYEKNKDVIDAKLALLKQKTEGFTVPSTSELKKDE